METKTDKQTNQSSSIKEKSCVFELWQKPVETWMVPMKEWRRPLMDWEKPICKWLKVNSSATSQEDQNGGSLL